MATNNKHVLAKALIRKGRVDYDLEFNRVSSEQVCILVHTFYDDSAPQLVRCAEEIAHKVAASGRLFSSADVEGPRHFLGAPRFTDYEGGSATQRNVHLAVGRRRPVERALLAVAALEEGMGRASAA